MAGWWLAVTADPREGVSKPEEQGEGRSKAKGNWLPGFVAEAGALGNHGKGFELGSWVRVWL